MLSLKWNKELKTVALNDFSQVSTTTTMYAAMTSAVSTRSLLNISDMATEAVDFNSGLLSVIHPQVILC